MTDVTRKIALLDLDAFFASVEVLRDPSLQHKPFAVGGGGDRGVVATANYLARRYGVKSAMPGSQARRLCPQLIFVKPEQGRYREMSKQVLALLSEVTDIIEPASIDEFYLDLSENQLFKGSASLTMQALRKKIEQLGITGSAGISCQKMVAKIASDENKPNGQFLVTPEQVFDYIAQLELKRIPGVGPKSQKLLAEHGLLRGADVQQTELKWLQQIIGDKAGYILHQRCRGIDNRPLVTHRIRKSVGVEQTLSADITRLATAQDYCQQQLLTKLKKRLGIAHWQEQPIRTQTVKLKFSDFTQTTVSRASQRVSPSLFYQLLEEAWQRGQDKGVRLLGISVSLPDPQQQQQLELDLD
ncbi:DNA polymerase IV [Idiomarina seosinensis]|uniref:DNA polymerase IV n=1 Tax=Idiomarina seosinensis TaxID=281739 RepID=UPI00384D1DA1